MRKFFSITGIFIVSIVAFLARAAESTAPLGVPVRIDFEKMEVGSVPEDFLVLDGGFAVREEKGNRFLELPGAPLDSFGVLLGPTADAGNSVAARIFGSARGRRTPTFGVGLNGQGGYKLQVAPGKKMLELQKGDSVVKSIPFEWESGTWTRLKLRTRKAGGESVVVEGKVWKEKEKEPETWLLTFDDTTAPSPGRPSLWGNPYAGTPIRYDDLEISTAGPGGVPTPGDKGDAKTVEAK